MSLKVVKDLKKLANLFIDAHNSDDERCKDKRHDDQDCPLHDPEQKVVIISK